MVSPLCQRLSGPANVLLSSDRPGQKARKSTPPSPPLPHKSGSIASMKNKISNISKRVRGLKPWAFLPLEEAFKTNVSGED